MAENKNIGAKDLFEKLDAYLEARDAAEHEESTEITVLDTFAADSLLGKGRGVFDADSTPDLPPLPAMMYDFVFYLLLHPGASNAELNREFGYSDRTITRWRHDPRVVAYLSQMHAEVRSLNMAQVSLLERAARNKAIEILNMRSTGTTIEEQGRLVRFILDLTAKMRGMQDSPLVSVNVSGGTDVGVRSRAPQSSVDEVIDLADELLAKRRALAKLKLEAQDVESNEG